MKPSADRVLSELRTIKQHTFVTFICHDHLFFQTFDCIPPVICSLEGEAAEESSKECQELVEGKELESALL